MIKIYNIYKNLIKENETSSNINFCIKSFGYELFGDQLGGNERNTEKEDEYLTLIKNFTIDEYGASITPEFINAINNLASCVSKYPEVLVTKGKVYRATRIPYQYIFKMVNKFNENNMVPYVYKANTIIQSWTEKYEIALIFSSGISGFKLPDGAQEFKKLIVKYKSSDNIEKIKILNYILNKFNFLNHFVPVILSVNAEDNKFLFKGKYFNKLSDSHDEYEVLRISNEPLQCMLECHEDLLLFTKEIKKFKKELNINKDDFYND